LSSAPDEILQTLIDLGGAGLAVVELGAGRPGEEPGAQGVIRLGVHRAGPLPEGDLSAFDILLSATPGAPRPWVGLAPDALEPALARLRAVVDAQPAAAAVAAQLLRVTLGLPIEQALALESLAYSMLLASEGFRAWRAANPASARLDLDRPRVAVSREADVLQIRMTRPWARNAVDAAMRDALFEALEAASLDPERPPIVLSGEGPSFSAGGDLAEFGSFGDPGRAHLIRVLRLPARLVWRLREQVTARVQGAAIGAGVEMSAAAGRLVAAPDAGFRLPEVGMGLIPGAGGTATIPRRIGRRRACFMAISGLDIDAGTALDWGLADAVEAFA
jgi:enoyl-CoA hydratase/carnithine racemase